MFLLAYMLVRYTNKNFAKMISGCKKIGLHGEALLQIKMLLLFLYDIDQGSSI